MVNQRVFAHCAWLPSFDSIRRVNSALTENAHGNFFSELKFPDDSISSSMFTFSSRSYSLIELSHNDWVSLLEGFDISDPGIGHVALYGRAIEIFAGPASSANCFIVRAFAVAEEEVVHGALTAGNELERFKDKVNHFL